MGGSPLGPQGLGAEGWEQGSGAEGGNLQSLALELRFPEGSRSAVTPKLMHHPERGSKIITRFSKGFLTPRKAEN